MKDKGAGLPCKSPCHNVLTRLVPASMVCWLSHGHRGLPSGNSMQMNPQLAFIENGTDPDNYDEGWDVLLR
jgi:hypothetical protein